MIIRAQMLMYGKEASNRKQEIDRVALVGMLLVPLLSGLFS